MEREFVLLKEYSTKSNIDSDFIFSLVKEGLVEMRQDADGEYLPIAELKQVELFSRLHYDLAVNVEGIDIIHNLLCKMEAMEQEMNILKKQLGYHESFMDDFFEDL